MGQKTEFEEPEYEGPLYNQLLSGSANLWTPGRRFERFFGIDAALFSNNHYFWSLFAQTPPIVGTILRHYNWHLLLRFINRLYSRPFPSYNVNVLIQSKRPKHRNGVNSAYSVRGIRGQYWLFEITKHQQLILEQLEQQLGNNALVVYACPVFHTFDDLDRYTANRQIVENSTFVKVSALRNHSKWVFDSPGTTGLACSKIEEHSDISFKEMLNKLREENQRHSDYPNFSHLTTVVNNICSENEKNPLVKAFMRRNKNLKEYFYSIRQEFDNEFNEKYYDNFINFMTFAQFTATLNTEWFTME
ncbi:MAG: hypothetical protein JSS64_10160 [Bacteroidetes bacterium]|nr:hypothetical protein [Bacteroidota bacterium]